MKRQNSQATSAKIRLMLCGLVAFAGSLSAADFHNGQAADVLLGQAGFDQTLPGKGQTGWTDPFGLARDPVSGALFVADYGNNRILRYEPGSTVPSAVFGQPGLGDGDWMPNQGLAAPTASTLFSPRGIFVDSQRRLWVADMLNNRVLCYDNAYLLGNNPPANRVFGQGTTSSFTTSTGGMQVNRLDHPGSVAVGPGPNGGTALWIADMSNHRVVRYDAEAGVATAVQALGVLGQGALNAANKGLGKTGMKTPEGVCADDQGRLWVADSGNHRVLRFDNAAAKADGDGAEADGVLGQPGFDTKTPATSAYWLSYPTRVFLDSSGALWVGDHSNSRVVRYGTPLVDGSTVNLVLGQTTPDTATPAAGSAGLHTPCDIAPGANGRIFVLDTGNNRVVGYQPVPDPPAALPKVTFKSKKKITTAKAKLTVKGTAINATRVLYRVGKKGAFHPARGTSIWSFRAKLRPGKNVVTVQATGPGGGSSTPARVTIIRK